MAVIIEYQIFEEPGFLALNANTLFGESAIQRAFSANHVDCGLQGRITFEQVFSGLKKIWPRYGINETLPELEARVVNLLQTICSEYQFPPFVSPMMAETTAPSWPMKS